MIGQFHSRSVVIILVLAVVVGQAEVAEAGVITDPALDFLPTYTGQTVGGLDVVSAGGTFDGTRFRLFATMNGPISAATNPLFVWGINTGTGNGVSFANIGAPGVVFTQAFTINGAGATNNAQVTGSVSGNDVSISIPLSLLPSTGFAPTDYTWNLWPRDLTAPPGPAPVGGRSSFADFAPNNSNEGFTVIPEPATLAVFGGIALAGALGYRRRKATANV